MTGTGVRGRGGARGRGGSRVVRGVGKGVIAVPLAGVARKGTKAEVASLLRNLDLAKYI